MPHKALIITSNQQLCQDIEDSLQGLSLEFHHADGYMQALSMVARYHYILVVMDLSFSEISGVDLIRRMRELEQTPILVLSTHATSSEEVETLNAGADRYLAFDHPLDTERCLANAAAIMRRSLTTDTKCYASILISGSGLKINFNLRKAFLDGQDLKLTPKEFAVLCNLARHMGEVVTKEQLYTFLPFVSDSISDSVSICPARTGLSHRLDFISRMRRPMASIAASRTSW